MQAPRRAGRHRHGTARGAGLAACLWLAGTATAQACFVMAVSDAMPDSLTNQIGPFGIRSAWYEAPTDIYGHGIMGEVRDAKRLHAVVAERATCTEYQVEAGPGHVFEDIAPRLVDVTGDGVPEVLAVRSSLTDGAQLAVYGLAEGKMTMLAATPPIGTPFRWLAPLGAADLDGDGAVELAYVDRPHFLHRLRIWRWTDGALVEVAGLSGVTNHRIGDEAIFGGIRTCGAPEMILADAAWTTLLAIRFDGADLASRPLDIAPGPESFERALAC
ncbi:MAG: VCBS repeat-containing protein [Pseudomonadota bacterium]